MENGVLSNYVEISRQIHIIAGVDTVAGAGGVLAQCRLMRPLASFIYETNVNY